MKFSESWIFNWRGWQHLNLTLAPLTNIDAWLGFTPVACSPVCRNSHRCCLGKCVAINPWSNSSVFKITWHVSYGYSRALNRKLKPSWAIAYMPLQAITWKDAGTHRKIRVCRPIFEPTNAKHWFAFRLLNLCFYTPIDEHNFRTYAMLSLYEYYWRKQDKRRCCCEEFTIWGWRLRGTEIVQLYSYNLEPKFQERYCNTGTQ
jgi:hypothetical protein